MSHIESSFIDLESGISDWGYLPTHEQQLDRDHVFIMELQLRGFRLTDLLECPVKDAQLNWRYGDPEKYLESHWQLFEPGYLSEQDEIVADAAIKKINMYRQTYEVFCVEPSQRVMREAGISDNHPYPLIAVMLRGRQITY